MLRLSLDAPLRMAVGTLQLRGTARPREAVRIRLRDDQGHVGLGEALPLPGYSRDDAAGAERALCALSAQVAEGGLQVSALRGAVTRLDATLAPFAALLAATPSARFALECALVDLLARREGLSAATWLADGHALQSVPVSVLLPDDASAAIAEAGKAVARGHRVLKLKVARPGLRPDEEDALLAAVREAIDAAPGPGGGRVLLRLDANGLLGADQAAPRLAALARFGVELVEEPAAGAALLQLPPLALPWAADESLADPGLAEALLALPAARRPAAWVLKPAQLGLARCVALARDAADHGLGVIVTHSFDGDLGYAAACALATALPLPPLPCGLAPHAGLSRPAPAVPCLQVPTAVGLGVPDQSGD